MTNALAPADQMTPLQLADEEVWKRLQPSKGKTLNGMVRSGEITVDDAPAIRRMLAAEEVACAPSRSQDRLALIEALLQHYPPRSMQGGETQFWKDWLGDTDGLPVSVLAEACAKWRRSKERFAPSPGQLLEKVRPDWKYRLKLLRMASEAIENGVEKTA